MSPQISAAPTPWALLEIFPACQKFSFTGESPAGLSALGGATQMPYRVGNLFPQSSCYHLANVANVWLVFEGCTACSYFTCPRPARSFLAELLSSVCSRASRLFFPGTTLCVCLSHFVKLLLACSFSLLSPSKSNLGLQCINPSLSKLMSACWGCSPCHCPSCWRW